MFFDEPLVGLGDLQGVELLAMDVLDEGDLELLLFGDVPNEDGDLAQAGSLGGPPTAFPDDDLIVIVLGGHDDRLHDARLLDRLGEFVNRLVVELDPRLKGVGLDVLEIELGEPLVLEDAELVRDERSQTFSQGFLAHRRMISSARLR